MAKITYVNKVNIQSQPVPEINKVTAGNLNEIKTSVNTNVDEITLKADIEVFVPFFNIINLGDVSGTVNLDWDLAVLYKANLIGTTTLTFTNAEKYQGTKTQQLQLTSNAAFAVNMPSGVLVSDFNDKSDPINFDLPTTTNDLSFRTLDALGSNYESRNRVTII